MGSGGGAGARTTQSWDQTRPSQSEPAPPLLNCPYPECLSSHLSPPPTPPPPPPFPLPSPLPTSLPSTMVFHSEGRVKRTRLMLARA